VNATEQENTGTQERYKDPSLRETKLASTNLQQFLWKLLLKPFPTGNKACFNKTSRNFVKIFVEPFLNRSFQETKLALKKTYSKFCFYQSLRG
jgi:hypothetical protein